MHKYSVVTLARWEDPYLVEWICYHKLIGFDHIYFYCNEDSPVKTYTVLLPFTGRHGFVTFIHFPYQGQQKHMYMHFMKHFKSETEWFCFLDIDEFLRIGDSRDIYTLMSSFPNEWDSIYFNWILFGNNGFKARPGGSVIQNYTRRESRLNPHTKSISKSAKIDPSKISGPFWHHWSGIDGLTKRNVIGDDMDAYWRSFPDSGREYLSGTDVQERIMRVAVINHYAFKSEDDFVLRTKRGILGEFTGQVGWKRLYESENFRGALDTMNAVEDTVLKHWWDAAVSDAACATGVVPWPRLPNLALGKSADQSSICEWSIGRTTSEDASRAVNGVITGRFNSCTGYERTPWWRIDLGRRCLIHEIRIFNRIDDLGCAERFWHFSVDISDDDVTWEVLFHKEDDKIVGGADGNPFIHTAGGAAARYVRIRLSGVNWLHLDQVEIYGVSDEGGKISAGNPGAPPGNSGSPAEPRLKTSERAKKMSDRVDRQDLGGNVWMGDSMTFMPKLWRFLVERYAVKSVLDVGCGEGHAVAFFHSLGIYAHGIDGFMGNIHRAVAPIALHDLLAGPYIMPVDLVWSCEVAEHIDPANVGNYLDTLKNGKIIAMTHALPGQPGHHHVNCQSSEYWIERMKQKGCSHQPEETQFLRGLASREETPNQKEIPNYFVRSGLIFYRL